MNKFLTFSKRNFKEIFRDPIIYIFCIGFPVVMMILFQVINSFSQGNTEMFNLNSLIPAMLVFSYSFVMLTMSLLVSKDRQTFLLKRLYSSPMKSHHFVLGYAAVGVVIGILQTFICIFTGLIIALASNVTFLSFGEVALLIISQLPMLIINVFLGVLFGSLFNDKAAPGFCSIFISLAGILGGCWMPLDSMGGFETFCRFLPFYPSVYIGRVISGASKTFGEAYVFDATAAYGLIPIVLIMALSVILSFVVFKKNMVSDK